MDALDLKDKVLHALIASLGFNQLSSGASISTLNPINPILEILQAGQ